MLRMTLQESCKSFILFLDVGEHPDQASVPDPQPALEELPVWEPGDLESQRSSRHTGSEEEGMHPAGEGMHPAGEGLHPVGEGLRPVGEGLHPVGEGLHPVGEGLHPVGEGLHPVGEGLHPVGEGLHPVGEGIYPAGEGIYPAGEGMHPAGEGMHPEEQEEVRRREEHTGVEEDDDDGGGGREVKFEEELEITAGGYTCVVMATALTDKPGKTEAGPALSHQGAELEAESEQAELFDSQGLQTMMDGCQIQGQRSSLEGSQVTDDITGLKGSTSPPGVLLISHSNLSSSDITTGLVHPDVSGRRLVMTSHLVVT